MTLTTTDSTQSPASVLPYIKGVNLGNWLVLEKWMNPALFDGTTADDEYYLPTQLSSDVYEARIRTHRSEYITERDFATIRSWGLNSVRIPVPYFIFGDRPPFIGCIDELDKAFNWADKYGLTILIDLHTAPMSQNGFDNGGISGVCKWAQLPDEVEFVLTVLERLAQRYGTRESLMGIEIINEPNTTTSWSMMDVTERYPAVDAELATGTGPIAFDWLKDFYVTAYHRLRAHLPEDKAVVFHDGFDIWQWKDFMRDGNEFKNVILDTHQYLMTAEMMGCPQTAEGYDDFVRNTYAPMIEEMSAYFPVIVGEWCLFNSVGCGVDTHGGQSVLNGEEGAAVESLTPQEKRDLYQGVAASQLEAWSKGSGYYYWNYKLLTDTVNTPGWIGWDAWDLGRCVAQDWFPVDHR
ncbi:beta-glucosidase [Bifidobacterium tissieri]|uniref:Beta-glucosidase n=2 Tax=Bifidobacterium tissieri TaxID=1630162 RepID=A0A261FC28_9BIFI|nr:beta-glucosidase [Bifidobacterium tissieri]